MAGYVAFLDESQSRRALDPDVYLLAATIVEESFIEDYTSFMKGLTRRGQSKLHWYDESDHRRRIITRAIATLDVRHIVVVQLCAPDARNERRRRLCMHRIISELDGSITSAIFESRGRKDDFRDRELVKAMHDSKQLSTRPHIDHRRGTDDPMLWIPDAVCGAVSRHRTGTPDYLDHLTEHSSITVITNDHPR